MYVHWPRCPFLLSSQPQLSKSPRLQFLVKVYITPAELMAWTNAVSRFAVKKTCIQLMCFDITFCVTFHVWKWPLFSSINPVLMLYKHVWLLVTVIERQWFWGNVVKWISVFALPMFTLGQCNYSKGWWWIFCLRKHFFSRASHSEPGMSA